MQEVVPELRRATGGGERARACRIRRSSNQMIRAVVDFALNNRFLVMLAAILLLVWGAISFSNLPIEAYPDVANNYVNIITQWPGRAAEEVEQQITIPIEIVMNGIPHLTSLRSKSVFGLSSVTLIFDDESGNDWNRQKALERLSQVDPAQQYSGADGHGLESGRPDLLVHADQHESEVRRDGAEIPRGLGSRETVQIRAERGRRLELWRPDEGISDPHRSRQTDFLRAQHRAGGAAAPEQQLERRRQLHRGRPAADQRPRSGALRSRRRHRKDRDQVAERHAAAHQRYRAGRSRARRSGWEKSARRSTAWTARSWTTTTWSKASFCCARAPNRKPRSTPFTTK